MMIDKSYYNPLSSPTESKRPRALSKLNDTSTWEKRKIKGRVAIQKMVVDLMELYLHRLKQKRPPYPKCAPMAEFASQFPYKPTPDQKQVLQRYSIYKHYHLQLLLQSKTSQFFFFKTRKGK